MGDARLRGRRDALGLGGKLNVTTRWEEACSLAVELFGEAAHLVSYQAFVKMLRRWTASLAAELTLRFRELMQAEFPNAWRVNGLVPIGVDGSAFELPRTQSNQEGFAARKPKRRQRSKQRRSKPTKASAKRKKSESAQSWVTTLWHLGVGLPWGCRMGPSGSSERGRLLDMAAELPAETLLAADAGFIGYELWRMLLASKRHFLIRVGSNVSLFKRLGCFRERKGLVDYWPSRAESKRLPPLTLRLIVLHSGRSPMHLLTSVLDEQQASDEQAAEIYTLCWGVELYCRDVKQTLGRRKLRSCCGSNVEVEATWTFLGYRGMMLHARARQGGPPRVRVKPSTVKILPAYRSMMERGRLQPTAAANLKERLSRAWTAHYPRQCKTSRDYPRKKQTPPIGPPKINVATEAQRLSAKEIRKVQESKFTA